MKRLVFFFALLATVATSPAIVISNYFGSGFVNGTTIPDGNLSGWSDTRTLSGYDGLEVTDVSVVLNISGGWNGDLYGYLTHSSGTVVLLDRVGKDGTHPGGYSNKGFSVYINDSLSGLTSLQGPGEGTPGSYSSSAVLAGNFYSKDGTLDTMFDTSSVNGGWTLFFADMASGDISTINSWSLVVTAVPEPTTWAAILFGVVFGGVQFLRYRRSKA